MKEIEYIFVEARLYSLFSQSSDRRTWKPCRVDGEDLNDPKNGPSLNDYARQMSKEGWEIVSHSTQGTDMSLIFRRFVQ